MLQPRVQSVDEQEHLPSLLAADAQELAHQLQEHQKKIFSPAAQKTMPQEGSRWESLIPP